MCTRVWVDGGKREIETQGDFAAYLGVSLGDLALDGRYSDAARQGKDCLCPVDVTGMLSAAGKSWSYDGHPMEIVIK